MCEAHINEVIRRTVPGSKKVSASHVKVEAGFLTGAAIDQSVLKDAIAGTGYTCLFVSSESYEKKGLFTWKNTTLKKTRFRRRW